VIRLREREVQDPFNSGSDYQEDHRNSPPPTGIAWDPSDFVDEHRDFILLFLNDQSISDSSDFIGLGQRLYWIVLRLSRFVGVVGPVIIAVLDHPTNRFG
jgi:hypothetical protein